MSERNLNLFAPASPVSASGRASGVRKKARAPVWTVAEVARDLRRLLEQSFANLWVAGEVSGFSRPRSGHCYFTLKDRTAQLRCVVYRSDAAKLPALPEEGMRVLVFGRLTFYDVRGAVPTGGNQG